MNVSDLSTGERVLINRRRLGVTQRVLAPRLGLTRRQLQDLEAGTFRFQVNEATIGFSSLDDLAENEVCVVLRHRSGKSMLDLEVALGVSRSWIYEMESGRESCDKLRAYWGF